MKIKEEKNCGSQTDDIYMIHTANRKTGIGIWQVSSGKWELGKLE